LNPAKSGASLLLVGNPDPMHVAAHLAAAARELACPTTVCDSRRAYGGNPIVGKLNWWLRARRPNRLRQFGEELVATCQAIRPRFMLATGIAPIEPTILEEIGRMGTIRLNYLTDDPWNPSHVAPWFLDALRHYDFVFSTRRSNLGDLGNHGCARLAYVPFAYAPELHYPERSDGSKEPGDPPVDVAFAGGADPDRVPLLASLIGAGFRVALYGGYWNRYRETRLASRGHADPDTIRKAIGSAKVALCLVRRANRDGSAMRTFELAAMGACMLAEYTEEHREILGEDAESVIYFRSPQEMVDRLHWLLAHDDERGRLRVAVRTRITMGGNTYGHRLQTMLSAGEAGFRS
jgi:hypothetical protein